MNSRSLRIFLLTLLLAVVFCLIATTFKIFTVDDLPLNFVAALLEAVVTAVITVVLLSGQSAAEEIKERNVAVFNDKSAIFKKYIETLWQTWDDHFVTKDEYSILTSIFYKELMLYLKVDSQRIIGESLFKIADFIEVDTNENVESGNVLRDKIEEIINVLISELSLGGKINHDLFIRLDQKMEICRKRSQRTTFKMLGIKPGTELLFRDDPSIIVKTSDDLNKVEYNGTVRSISNVSDELIGRPTNGFTYFLLNGKSLWDIRKKNEK